MAAIFVGVMSGTSLDGADAAIIDFAHEAPRSLGLASIPFPESLRSALLALSESGEDGVDAVAQASCLLADLYAEAVELALRESGVRPEAVTAIGCHGQTVRHRPERGYTVQINDPARLVERIGIDVVADFRRRDVAAGGQGAPLVPAFHDAVFRSATLSRAIVNIGGISNASLLPAGSPHLGYDCGPGNVLMDAWIHRHLGASYDAGGAWAARGKVNEALLSRLLDDEYFARVPPKSTGRERFNLSWLEAKRDGDTPPEDVQATLLELTARAILDSIQRFGPETREIYLCGGGARNAILGSRIASLSPGRRVSDTQALGIAPEAVEAAAFAWLAMKSVRREAIDNTRVTGARGPRILGAIYPR
ncbi:anhydro-N-acetylmuramic acid kinase [Betaproteobacteria bacterium GR16-43]|nr:anhydro-N-acetylmuramic acid kinase [Betaproteobacteria bacterium GR16-43]